MIDAIERESDAAPVRVLAKRDAAEAAFELKRDAGAADAPARGGGFAVLYVNPRGPAPSRDELVAGATALAARLAESPPSP